LLAALAAEQIVDRLSACLADDVPERLLDGALRAVQVERAAPLTKVIVDRLQKVLDVERAAAHAGLAQLRDLADDSAVPSSQRIGLAPAMDAGVRADFHEEPCSAAEAGIDRKTPDRDDLHMA